MPIGESWGDAYIEVHADTSRLSAETRRAARKAGADAGADFGKGFDAELDDTFSAAAQRLRRTMASRGRLIGKDFIENVETGINQRLRSFDIDLADAFLTGDWEKVVAQFDDLDTGLERVQHRLEALAAADNRFTPKRLNEALESLSRWGNEVREIDLDEKMWDDAIAANTKYDNSVKKMTEDIHHNLLRIIDDHDEYNEHLQRRIDLDHEVATGINRITSRSQRWSRALSDNGRDMEFLGRLAGSRNNFFNLVGRAAGVAERLTGNFFEAIAQFPAKIARFGDLVSANGGGFQGFITTLQSGIAGLGASFKTFASTGGIGLVIAAVGALVAGVTAFGAIAAVASTALSGLLGIVTALASALAFGLAGAIGPLLPLLLALAAGVGAVVIAFSDLDGELDAATKPFKDFYDAIKKPVQERLFKNLARDAESFKGTLNNFVGPLMLAAADALSGTITYLADAFEKPSVQRTLSILGETLPGILSDMGRGLTDFVTGALGFFAPLSIYAADLAQSISDAAWEFSQWSNSVAGQNAISDFFARARESAQILWGLITSVGGALGTLFSQGQETGNNFLTKITEIVDKFTEWANSPEGRDQIASWLAFAEELAGELADAIGKVGEFLIGLDTPRNREILIFLVDMFGAMVDVLGVIADVGATTFSGLIGIVQSLQGHIQRNVDQWRGLRDSIVEVGMRAAGPLGSIAAKIAEIIASAKGASGFFTETIPSAIRTAIRAIERFIAALGRINIPSAISSAASFLRERFATGGTVFGPTRALIGEAGPEAVVPLNRPLSQVDPSVRWLSAIAQGRTTRMASGGMSTGGNQINVASGAFTVVTPIKNPVLLTHMILDGLVAETA